MLDNTLSNQHILECLKSHYGIDVVALEILPLGADMNSSVYRADSSDKLAYFVKLKQGHDHDISVDIVGLLQAAGMQQIISPVKTTDGQLTKRIDDFTLIVYPFIEGEDGFVSALSEAQWIIFGKALRQVHEIELPLPLQNRVRREEYSPQWRESVRALYAASQDEISGDEPAFKLFKFMQENATTIHRLVDGAEQLAEKIQNEHSKFVLCHSDIHAGNVLIDKNKKLYLVDWDAPIMAAKERDLMFIGAGVGNVWNNPQEATFFYQGYGKTEINMTMLAYYRHERIVEDIALYGWNLLLTTDGGNDRALMYQHFMAMFEPKGVVEMAFETATQA